MNLFYSLNSQAFPGLMRIFFGPIVKFIYFVMECLIDAMYKLAGKDFGLGEHLESLEGKIFNLLIIFMIFKLTLSFLNYIIDPESVKDKGKGVSKLVQRIIISIIMLISISPFFKILSDVQADILDEQVLDKFILGDSSDEEFETNGYVFTKIKMNDEFCEDDEFVYTYSKGAKFSILALRPFYQPSTKTDKPDEQQTNIKEIHYCGLNNSEVFGTVLVDDNGEADIATNINNTPNSASKMLTSEIYTSKNGDWDPIHDEYFDIEFNYIWALIVGCVISLLIITTCFDIVVRAISLFFYQVIAPVPIIMYMSPKGKDSEVFGKWLKATMTVWASLFIRLIIFDFIIFGAGLACETVGNSSNGLIMQIVILIGFLIFAKKLPSMIEELFPGLKMGKGLQLNPFKKIADEALGGKQLLGAGALFAAGTMSAASNLATGIENNLMHDNKPGFGISKGKGIKENIKNNAKATGRLLRGTSKTAGSVLAGFTSAGGRAFMKTSKNGNVFGGIKEGHLEAQFAKQQRDDLIRKGSTVKGRAAADFNRWIGRYNAGQRQHMLAETQDIEINKDLDNLRNAKADLQDRKAKIKVQKENATRDYTNLKTKLDALKTRIDSQGDVKKASDKLETIKNTDFSSEFEQYKLEKTRGIEQQYSSKIESAKQKIESINNSKIAMDPSLKASNLANAKMELENLEKAMQNDINNSMTIKDVVQYKENKIKEQSYILDVERAKYIQTAKNDKVLQDIIGDINAIKANNSEIAGNSDFDIISIDKDTKEAKFNKAAVYKVSDEIETISHKIDIEKGAAEIEIREKEIEEAERIINARKQSDDYVNAHNKNSAAMADNAAKKVAKGGQNQGWLPSGDVNAGGTVGYAGNAYYSRNNGPGGGHGGPPPGP